MNEVIRMELDAIKTPEDILEFMKTHIKYGWLDIYNQAHIGNMKDFRKLYRTSSIEEVLQTNLMHYLLNKIGIKNKMFCCRIYEPNHYDNMEAEEHMHCFVLYEQNHFIYHIEHPNWEKIGIYQYPSEEEALSDIVQYYVQKSGGVERPTTAFYEV